MMAASQTAARPHATGLPFIADHLTSDSVGLSSDSDGGDDSDCETEERIVNRMAQRNAAWHSWPKYANRARPYRKRPRDEDAEARQTPTPNERSGHNLDMIHNRRWRSPCAICKSLRESELMFPLCEKAPWVDVMNQSDFVLCLLLGHRDCAVAMRNQRRGERERSVLELAAGGAIGLDTLFFLPQIGHGVKNGKHGERLLKMALRTGYDAEKVDRTVRALVQIGAVPSSATVYWAAQASLRSLGREILLMVAIADEGYPSRQSHEVEERLIRRMEETIESLLPAAVLNDDPIAIRLLGSLHSGDLSDVAGRPWLITSAPSCAQAFYFHTRSHGSAMVNAVPDMMISRLFGAYNSRSSSRTPHGIGSALLLKMEATRGFSELV